LAETTKRAAGFADVHSVDGPKALISEGFALSPMVPRTWPASDCTVVFYVFRAELYLADSAHVYRDPIVAGIALRLDSGDIHMVPISNAPGSGVLPHGGGGTLEPRLQQWVFD